MKTYDFIFSNQPRYRISRHVLFWFCWLFFTTLAYHIPMYDVFPYWNIKARMDYAQSKHGVDFITLRGGMANMIWEIISKQLRILLCLMALTYSVIYYILPLYFSKSKKWLLTTFKLSIIFTIFLALLYYVSWLNLVDHVIQWKDRGGAGKMPTPIGVIKIVRGVFIFNIPTLLGVAIGVKLLKRWWLKQKETEQLAREKLSAELQLLKAQVHPHFLFNSLNNIYSFALERSPKAPEMIQKLSDLLHYMLYECKQPMVSLQKELQMIADYISLEKIRYGERLRIDLQIQQNGDQLVIAPLLLIPFVENSFKHGTSKMLSRPEITLHISVLENTLQFKLSNSRPDGIDEPSLNGNRGLGLKNVKKRLTLLYPRQHELQIIDEPSCYTVWLKIALPGPRQANSKEIIQNEIHGYELA